MKKLFKCLLIAGFALNSGVLAQTQLDGGFGAGGKSIIQTNFLAYVDDIAIGPDNKIIHAAPCRTLEVALIPFCLTRMNEDGTLDSTFKGGTPVIAAGGVFTSFTPVGSGLVRGVIVQSDNKVIAVGSGPGGQDAVLIRYNADGSLDSSFGSGGIAITAVSTAADRAEKAALQPDDKIVVVGTAGNFQFIARYMPDGTLDSSFGQSGIVKSIDPAQGSSIALQPDGKIVVGGSGGSGYQLTRLNSDGSPDTSWDGDGVLSVPGSGALGFRSIGLQADGRVVALGQGNIIYRFTTNGMPDSSFHSDGARPAFAEGAAKDAYSLIVSASGKITVIGTGIPPECQFNVPCPDPGLLYFTTRYNPDGFPDQNYGVFGDFDVNVGGGAGSVYNGARTIASDSLNRVVVGGVSSSCCVRTYWQTPRYSAMRITPLPTTLVSVSGRVTDANGNGVSGVTVSTQGGISARTTPFGYYTLSGVSTNRSYTFSVRSKSDVVFNKRTIVVDDKITGLDFVGTQPDGRTIQIEGPAPDPVKPSIRTLK